MKLPLKQFDIYIYIYKTETLNETSMLIKEFIMIAHDCIANIYTESISLWSKLHHIRFILRYCVHKRRL